MHVVAAARPCRNMARWNGVVYRPGMTDPAPVPFTGTAYHATIEANAPETPAGGGDHGPCQRAGRAIRQDGYEAARYPSAVGDGINLVVFWDRRRPDSSLRLAGRLDARD